MPPLNDKRRGAAERAASHQNRGIDTTLLEGAAHESKGNPEAFVCQSHDGKGTCPSRVVLGLCALFSARAGVATSPANPWGTEQEDPLVAATAGAGLAEHHLVHRRISRRTLRDRPGVLCDLSAEAQTSGHDAQGLRTGFGTLAHAGLACLGQGHPAANRAAFGSVADDVWFHDSRLRRRPPGGATQRRTGTTLALGRQNRCGSDGLRDGVGARRHGVVVGLANGFGYGQRTFPFAMLAEHRAEQRLDRRRCGLCRLRAVPSDHGPRSVLPVSGLVARLSVHRAAHPLGAVSRGPRLLLAGLGAKAEVAAPAPALAVHSRQESERLVADQCARCGAAVAHSGRADLSLALAKRGLFSHLQTDPEQIQTAEPLGRLDPPRGGGFAAGGATALGPRCLGTARRQAGRPAAQSPPTAPCRTARNALPDRRALGKASTPNVPRPTRQNPTRATPADQQARAPRMAPTKATPQPRSPDIPRDADYSKNPEKPARSCYLTVKLFLALRATQLLQWPKRSLDPALGEDVLYHLSVH